MTAQQRSGRRVAAGGAIEGQGGVQGPTAELIKDPVREYKETVARLGQTVVERSPA